MSKHELTMIVSVADPHYTDRSQPVLSSCQYNHPVWSAPGRPAGTWLVTSTRPIIPVSLTELQSPTFLACLKIERLSMGVGKKDPRGASNIISFQERQTFFSDTSQNARKTWTTTWHNKDSNPVYRVTKLIGWVRYDIHWTTVRIEPRRHAKDERKAVKQILGTKNMKALLIFRTSLSLIRLNKSCLFNKFIFHTLLSRSYKSFSAHEHGCKCRVFRLPF